MNPQKQRTGCVSRSLDWLWMGGRANREAARRFLGELRKLHKQPPPKNRLLHYRHDYRRLLADQPIEVFREHLFDACPLTRSVAVWLLSHCATRYSLLDIDRRCDDSSPMVRKHVAKALHRLEARLQLAEMAKQCPRESAVQWYAQDRPNDIDFRDRLHRFSIHSDHSQIEAAVRAEQMALWSRVENWFWSPPKSRGYMRRVLKRVQRAVRGTN